MKKFTIILLAATMILGLAGAASALVFTDTKDFSCLGGLEWGQGEVSWAHNTPADFVVPPDTVNSASLKISASYVDGNNDEVWVEKSLQGTLTENKTWLFGLISDTKESVFDITDIFASWGIGDKLDVTLKYNEGCFNVLKLHNSVFTLDYDKGSNTAPVPEPTTMLLFGSGLLSLVGVARKRLNKKDDVILP